MKATLSDPAKAELREAAAWYAEKEPALGHAFLDAVEAGLRRIEEGPERCQRLSDRTRRCLVKRFPYGLIYEIRETEILIVAVMHLRRNPTYWQDRI